MVALPQPLDVSRRAGPGPWRWPGTRGRPRRKLIPRRCRSEVPPRDAWVEAGSRGARPTPMTDEGRGTDMRFMVMVKANADSEAGTLPTQEQLAEMGAFNEELVKAGVMLAGEGLQDSSKGARVRFGEGRSTTVVDGPFAEAKELIAGFWLWQVSSREEAIEWVRRAPFLPGDEIEIRQVFEAEDFGEAFTPELREQEERLREQVAGQQH